MCLPLRSTPGRNESTVRHLLNTLRGKSLSIIACSKFERTICRDWDCFPETVSAGGGSGAAGIRSQEQIGEALGITAVHANRVIKQLRQDGIVAFHRGRVEVLDEDKLLELAGFDGRYLHLSPAL